MVLHKIAENVAAPVPFRLPPKAARAAASALAVMWLQKTSSLTTSGSQLRMFGFKFPDPSERLLIKLGGDNLMLENVEVGPSNYDKRQNMAEQRSPFFSEVALVQAELPFEVLDFMLTSVPSGVRSPWLRAKEHEHTAAAGQELRKPSLNDF